MAKKNNDDRISDLKRYIALKKVDLKKVDDLKLITNCRLTLDFCQHDFKQMDFLNLSWLLLKLNGYRMSADDLGLINLVVDGHKLEDWVTDVRTCRAILNKKQEEVRLKELELKLTNLLSEEKRTAVIIDELGGQI